MRQKNLVPLSVLERELAKIPGMSEAIAVESASLENARLAAAQFVEQTTAEAESFSYPEPDRKNISAPKANSLKTEKL